MQGIQQIQRFQPRNLRTNVMTPYTTATVKNDSFMAKELDGSLRPAVVHTARTNTGQAVRAITANVVTPNDRTTGLTSTTTSTVRTVARKIIRQPVATVREWMPRQLRA